MRLFGNWLERTLALQRATYGTDPPSLRGRDRADYWRTQVLAAEDELHEFLDEVSWKPWANDEGQIIDREAAVKELVDALHFVANLACSIGVSDAELSSVYHDKMMVNADRQERTGGYDSVTNRCKSCRRALDDVGTHQQCQPMLTAMGGDMAYFTICNACGKEAV